MQNTRNAHGVLAPNSGLRAAIEEPAAIVRILTHLGLPARAPPRAPARPLALFRAA
jgi:hypothetical protein